MEDPLYRPIPRLAALLALLLAASAYADGHEAHVDVMAKEHATDAPVASPASSMAPRLAVEDEDVVYAMLAGRPLRGFLARPQEGLSLIHI